LQRFISEDPIEFESGDFNLFAYVMNKPTTYTDPLGLDHAKRLGECLVLAGCVDKNGKRKTKSDPPPPKPKPKPDWPSDPCKWVHCPPPPATCTTPVGVCNLGRPLPNVPDPATDFWSKGEDWIRDVYQDLLEAIFGGKD
jgi:hypothetical protein